MLIVHQLEKPGAPFVYGIGAGSAFDMRTFVDVWMSPEGILAGAASMQLATGLGLPTWDYAGYCDAKSLDAQLAVELAATTLSAGQSGASMYHDVGEFESGVQNSLESVVLGDVMAGFARRLRAGFVVDDETLQLDDIEAVGPGGSFLSRPYTRRRHRDAWRSPVFDNWHPRALGGSRPADARGPATRDGAPALRGPPVHPGRRDGGDTRSLLARRIAPAQLQLPL